MLQHRKPKPTLRDKANHISPIAFGETGHGVNAIDRVIIERGAAFTTITVW